MRCWSTKAFSFPGSLFYLMIRLIFEITNTDLDDYESEGKGGHGFYSGDMYLGEDGQLSWFNAGVRVGVGTGLGMCVGVGIGVGLLMRSYQATTSNLRRRFF